MVKKLPRVKRLHFSLGTQTKHIALPRNLGRSIARHRAGILRPQRWIQRWSYFCSFALTQMINKTQAESFLSWKFHENGGTGISELAIPGILRGFRCYDISGLRMRYSFKYMRLIGILARFISDTYHGVMKVFLCRDRMAIVSTAQQKPNFPWSWIWWLLTLP